MITAYRGEQTRVMLLRAAAAIDAAAELNELPLEANFESLGCASLSSSDKRNYRISAGRRRMLVGRPVQPTPAAAGLRYLEWWRTSVVNSAVNIYPATKRLT